MLILSLNTFHANYRNFVVFYIGSSCYIYVFYRKHLFNYHKSFKKLIIQYGVLIYGCSNETSLNQVLKNQKLIKKNKTFQMVRDSVRNLLIESKISGVFEMHHFV